MDFLVKILTNIIIQINRVIDSIDKKTVETIKRSFYGVVFLLVIIGIIIGYNNGMGAAKRHGDPLAKYTNMVFDVTIKRERDKSVFSSMLETELLGEISGSDFEKIGFPSNERLKSEFDDNIIEPDTSPKKMSIPTDIDNREKIAEIDRLENSILKSEVKELEKRSNSIKMRLPMEKITDKKSTKTMANGSNRDVKNKLQPIENPTGVIER